MAKFQYRIKAAYGEYEQGVIEANSEILALQQLAEQGHAILSIKEVAAQRRKGLLSYFYQAKIDTLLHLFTQLSFLLRSGVPLFQSIEMVIPQTADKELEQILKQVKHDLAEGKSLAASMRKHPQVFSDLHISMVVVGESSGRISEALQRIVEIVQEERSLRKKIAKATTYPTIVLSLAAITLTGILLVVVPKFEKIFVKAQVKLPLVTQILLELSRFMRAHWLELLIGTAFLISLLWTYTKSNRGKILLDRLKFNLPLISELSRDLLVTNFSRTLSSLLKAGVPLMKALEICRDTSSSPIARNIYTDLVARLKEGSSVAQSLKRHKLFPQVMIQLTGIGEESGHLDAVMDNVHMHYKERVDSSLNKTTSFIEPALMIALGILILSIAMALFLPIFRLSETLRRR